ncbi:hypothetical protein VST7929_02539 [Vibrio stylophorae]|uniref:SHS2 domain-containing protein n=1 Tax=Vibrio stylophorae TaxID=659351 RepID=A0ABM8ZWB2_9VIBR|nr:type IV pilus assembly protein PilM [Vibrio stylophorae]CAH0534595.1 hypothetical protein VST7929_02539 [Vibrio stylophorae]
MFSAPPIVGIDIGTYSLQAVVANANSKELELIGCEEITLSAKIIDDQHVANVPQLTSALSQLKKRLPSGATKVLFALPDSVVINKLFSLEDDLDDQEVDFSLRQNVVNTTALSDEQLALDYKEASHQENTMTYRVFATRRNIIDSLIEASENAGLEPVIIDVQSNVIERLTRFIKYNERRPDWATVDLGNSRISINILSSISAFYNRQLTYGLNGFSLSGAMLESDDYEMGFDQEQYNDYLDGLVEQIRRELALYQSSSAVPAVQGIALYGGGAMLRDIEQKLSELLNLPVETFDPLKDLSHGQFPLKSQSLTGARFVLATGLALRGAKANA